MRTPLAFALLLSICLAVAGCGSSGGGSSAPGATTPPPAVNYVMKDGTLTAAGGIFAGGVEKNTPVKVYTGDRAGDVSFYSYALAAQVEASDGYTFTAAVSGVTYTFRVEYNPAAGSLRLYRPASTTHSATWAFDPVAVMPRGNG